MRRMPLVAGLFVLLLSMQNTSRAAELPNPDEINPLLEEALQAEQPAAPPAPAARGFSSLFEDSSLGLRSIYYGRDRDAYNKHVAGEASDRGEIHVNAFGQGVDFRSGYAWDAVGFDVTGQTNLGYGRGWSEVLLHEEPENRDYSSLSLGQAALKAKLGTPDFGFQARGGYTPIRVGSLGTSGGLHSHAYRGFETKFAFKDFELGYGWADQFRNDWDDTFRDMTNAWHQNRWGRSDGRRIAYIHSLGLRRAFGLDKAGFVDLGVGEGLDYRRNVQAAVSIPFQLCDFGILTFAGYGMAARYQPRLGISANSRTGEADARETEYHVSGSVSLKTGGWTFMAGLGHTYSPNSGEMQFRLTAWANSDNRNFIQTWGQLDDFVWDGQNVAKLGVKYELGRHVPLLRGLTVGASGILGWNAKNGIGKPKSRGWEVDYFAEYAIDSGWAKGLSLGVYAGNLRYRDNDFAGKQNRNDVKAILSYSRTLENFLRPRVNP